METGKRVGVQVWVRALWQGNEESKVMRERLHQTAVWSAEDTVLVHWVVGCGEASACILSTQKTYSFFSCLKHPICFLGVLVDAILSIFLKILEE